MRFVVPAVLVLLAAIHVVPVVGVASTARLYALYGVTVEDPNLEILLRHRALLFGLLGALLAYAAIRPELHRLGLLAAFVSVTSFLVLAYEVGGFTSDLSSVVRADIVALVLVVIGGVTHVSGKGKA